MGATSTIDFEKILTAPIRGGGTGGAGGATAPPTFGILLSMHHLAPPKLLF